MDHSRKFPTFRTSKWKGAWTYWSKLNWWNLALMIKQSCEHIRIIGHLHSKAADLMSFSQCSVSVHYLRYNNGHLKGMLIDPCISLHIIKLVILQFRFSTHRSYGWCCSVCGQMTSHQHQHPYVPSHLLGCQERPVLFNANAAFSRVFDGIPNIAFLKIMLI